jgi:hypothetical protein
MAIQRLTVLAIQKRNIISTQRKELCRRRSLCKRIRGLPAFMGSETFKYWAFISYSHADKPFADWLHRSLERYRVPKQIFSQSVGLVEIPKRVFPIFRDREELPASADLSHRINEALRLSRSLIVICSPNSARSRWVNEEIRFFKSLGREDRVL